MLPVKEAKTKNTFTDENINSRDFLSTVLVCWRPKMDKQEFEYGMVQWILKQGI